MYESREIYNAVLVLLKPTKTNIGGVHKKTYQPISQGMQFNASFKSYGGTERDVNGILSVEDTATVETWYNPEIASDCAVAIAGTDKIYEILGDPEDIDLRHRTMRFKVKRVKGGA